MFCPRCGTQAAETIKYCRTCGLPLQPLTSYLASGGTAPLNPEVVSGQTSPTINQLKAFWMGLSPKQQMIVSILFFVFLPGILAVLGGLPWPFHLLHSLVPLAGVIMPVGIVWSVLHAKSVEARLKAQQASAINTSQLNQFTDPRLTAPHLQAPPYQAPASPSQTIPLQGATPIHGSVIEDETQRLPQPPRQNQ